MVSLRVDRMVVSLELPKAVLKASQMVLQSELLRASHWGLAREDSSVSKMASSRASQSAEQRVDHLAGYSVDLKGGWSDIAKGDQKEVQRETE